MNKKRKYTFLTSLSCSIYYLTDKHSCTNKHYYIITTNFNIKLTFPRWWQFFNAFTYVNLHKLFDLFIPSLFKTFIFLLVLEYRRLNQNNFTYNLYFWTPCWLLTHLRKKGGKFLLVADWAKSQDTRFPKRIHLNFRETGNFLSVKRGLWLNCVWSKFFIVPQTFLIAITIQ